MKRHTHTHTHRRGRLRERLAARGAGRCTCAGRTGGTLLRTRRWETGTDGRRLVAIGGRAGKAGENRGRGSRTPAVHGQGWAFSVASTLATGGPASLPPPYLTCLARFSYVHTYMRACMRACLDRVPQRNTISIYVGLYIMTLGLAHRMHDGRETGGARRLEVDALRRK
ncbi:hypothetical protein GGS23DRAFT_140893 [Durotheca rogersii]|uniref:uncharacterized protein n=1 Tax=Durotheca rogersii TaxID=419775 RepID=UPI00221FC0E8|nr:uncharacterized protein GGS23DRAFT_140893 [Durotheca rogersii]KAI5861595.1 hypothetical protein GGS23DRAFT_140893 [Durotheca rogersii]